MAQALTNAELRDKIASEKNITKIDLQKWDLRTRGGMEGRIREAQRNIEVLEGKLKTNLVTNSAVIVGTEDVSNEILNAISEKYDSEHIDFLELERKLVNAVYSGSTENFRLGNEFQVRLSTVLAQLAREMGAVSVPTPAISANKYGIYQDKEEIVKILHEAFTRELGLELKSKYMYVTLDAIANKHVNLPTDSLSIVVTNVPENFLPIFTSTTNFLITISGNPDLGTAVLYTDGDTQEDIEARIVEAIKTRKA